MQQHGISHWEDPNEINQKLKRLTEEPIWEVSREYYERTVLPYFSERCRASRNVYERAKDYLPGGVQHNLAFNKPFPLCFTRADGAWLYDRDGNRYIDFLQAGGATILGSNYPAVREKVLDLLRTCGPVTGLLHESELMLAEEIHKHMPEVEMFRMLGSGTESVMASLRIARIATGHKRVIKTGGAYHGWSDQMIYGTKIPGSRGLLEAHGIPKRLYSLTDEVRPNDLDYLEHMLRRNRCRGGTAAVIVEPCGPESGTRPIGCDYNRGVRELCDRYGALMIMDEVVTGFRVSMAGAQGYFNVIPDLTIFGKIIAGGYPGAGGVGGHADCMQHLGAGLDSTGKKIKKAMCGGTMAATPLSCCAGYFTIEEIEKTNACEKAGRMADRLTKGIQESVRKYHLPFVVFNQGSICHVDTVGTMHFSIDWSKPWQLPTVLKETSRRQIEMEHIGAAYMAEGIISLAGSRLYTSAAYTEEMIDDVIARLDRVFDKCGKLDD